MAVVRYCRPFGHLVDLVTSRIWRDSLCGCHQTWRKTGLKRHLLPGRLALSKKSKVTSLLGSLVEGMYAANRKPIIIEMSGEKHDLL